MPNLYKGEFRWLGPAALALCLCGGLLTGCGDGAGQISKADPLAASNPDAKAKELLDQFAKVSPGEREDWVRQNEFALMVFEQVKDADLLSKYKQEIVPLKGAQR